jgi:small redox-active disulfide protein 2
MRVIEVFGPGCANCQRVEANAREAIAKSGVQAVVRHVTDYREIASRGVLQTPGLAIDGKLVSTGRVPSAGDIAAWLGQPNA